MAPLGQAAAGRKNLAKFLGIDMRAGTTGMLTMMILVIRYRMRMVMTAMMRMRISWGMDLRAHGIGRPKMSMRNQS